MKTFFKRRKEGGAWDDAMFSYQYESTSYGKLFGVSISVYKILFKFQIIKSKKIKIKKTGNATTPK